MGDLLVIDSSRALKGESCVCDKGKACNLGYSLPVDGGRTGFWSIQVGSYQGDRDDDGDHTERKGECPGTELRPSFVILDLVVLVDLDLGDGLGDLGCAAFNRTRGRVTDTEEEGGGTEGPEKREDEADPKEPLAGRYPGGPLIRFGDLFLLGDITSHTERPLMDRSPGSVRRRRVMEAAAAAAARGGMGSNDDTTERASARKGPRNRESMSTRYIQGCRLVGAGVGVGVGCLGLGFDQRGQVVEPESALDSCRAEIDVLELEIEIDNAGIVREGGRDGRCCGWTAGINAMQGTVPHFAEVAPVCVVLGEARWVGWS